MILGGWFKNHMNSQVVGPLLLPLWVLPKSAVRRGSSGEVPRARARPLGDEVRQRRQREVGRVVVVVSLDRAKVSSSTFGESS